MNTFETVLLIVGLTFGAIVVLALAFIAWVFSKLARHERQEERRQSQLFTCEVCRGAEVVRRGDWDFCPAGHTYIGRRAAA